jgi:4-amino-4-deoxy-L-arabinose transferase-like glycosyltransferase
LIRRHPSPRILSSVLFFFAVLMSLTFSFAVLPGISGPLRINIDPDRLGELSRNIAEHHAFSYGEPGSLSTAYDRGPVYPLLLGSIRMLSGDRWLIVIQTLQAVFHGLTGVLLFLLGRSVFGDARTGLTAQTLHAVHPLLVWYTARVWIETTHTMLVVALCAVLVSLWHRPRTSVAVAAGLLWGVAVLTKSLLLLLPVSMMALAFGSTNRLVRKGLLICMATGLLLVVPWTVRNYVGSGRIVPVHTSLGLNMVQGEIIADPGSGLPLSTATLWEAGKRETDSLLGPMGFAAESPEGDAYLVRAVTKSWLHDPGSLLRRVIVNGATFWYLSESPLKSYAVMGIQVPLLLILARVFGPARRIFRGVTLLAWIIAYYWLAHAFIVGWARYSAPIVPICLLVAAGGWLGWRKERLRAREEKRMW